MNDNADTQITFHARAPNSAKHISDMLGQMTVTERRESTSRKAGSLFVESITESEQSYASPLLRPDDIMRLPYDEAIVSIGGMHPYRGKKVMYYLDERFRDCASLPAPDSVEAQQAELPPTPVHGWTDEPIEPAMDVLEELKKRFGIESDDDAGAVGEQPKKSKGSGKGKRKKSGDEAKKKPKKLVISSCDAVEEAADGGAPF